MQSPVCAYPCRPTCFHKTASTLAGANLFPSSQPLLELIAADKPSGNPPACFAVASVALCQREALEWIARTENLPPVPEVFDVPNNVRIAVGFLEVFPGFRRCG